MTRKLPRVPRRYQFRKLPCDEACHLCMQIVHPKDPTVHTMIVAVNPPFSSAPRTRAVVMCGHCFERLKVSTAYVGDGLDGIDIDRWVDGH